MGMKYSLELCMVVVGKGLLDDLLERSCAHSNVIFLCACISNWKIGRKEDEIWSRFYIERDKKKVWA